MECYSDRTMAGHELDTEIVLQVRRGDEQAFLMLYRKLQPSIYRFALNMTGSFSVAEDITQEVFLALIREDFGYLPDRGTLSGYLFGIARKLVLRHLERNHGLAEQEAGEGANRPNQAFGRAVFADPATDSPGAVAHYRHRVFALTNPLTEYLPNTAADSRQDTVRGQLVPQCGQSETLRRARRAPPDQADQGTYQGKGKDRAQDGQHRADQQECDPTDGGEPENCAECGENHGTLVYPSRDFGLLRYSLAAPGYFECEENINERLWQADQIETGRWRWCAQPARPN